MAEQLPLAFPLLEATCKHTNPSLTTHLSGASPACQEPPQVALDRQCQLLVGQIRGKGSKLGEGKGSKLGEGKGSKLGEEKRN